MAETLSGRVCPMDQTPLTPRDDIVCCSICGTLHHARCWRENRTCTTLDCSGVPQRVVVALETSVEVKQLNAQLDEMRASLSKVNRKLDRVADTEQEAATRAVQELGRVIESSLTERKQEAQQVLARLTELLLATRSLDRTFTRDHYAPPARKAAPKTGTGQKQGR